jgi:multicomponent Na+:H+ antiporter subunit A
VDGGYSIFWQNACLSEIVMSSMILLTVALPFIAAVLAIPVVRVAPRMAGWLLAIAPLTSFALLLGHLLGQSSLDAASVSAPWIPSLGIVFSLRLDGLSMSFALLVSGIGVLISIYSGPYFKGDPRLGRFFLFLFAFMGAMMGIVLAGDLITVYLFWELTSITSYLLIGFDNANPKARANALQGLLVTVGGGLAMLAGFILLGEVAGSYAFEDLFAAAGDIRAHSLYLPILVLILIGACTKSAQFPFHFWLPNAMTAPTPVSAFLHSSTMVKAGVFLLARLHPVLGGTDPWHLAVTLIGVTTAVVGALLALRCKEMKPLLAYTTISALGLLVACLGIGTPGAAEAMVAFLIVHAFYKAAMFMVAGMLYHQTGQMNAEKLARLAGRMPLTMLGAALGGWAMASLLPVLGFIGKELLYQAALDGREPVLIPVAAIAAAFVFANMGNVFAALLVGWRPFWARDGASGAEIREGPLGMWLGPLVLGVAGLAFGLYAKPIADGLVAPAAGAIIGAPVTSKLVLWHGITLALVLSLVTVAGGLALFVLRSPVRRVLALIDNTEFVGPEAAYHGAFQSLQQLAALQTRVLQNGYLRYYLLTIVAFVLLLPGSVLVGRIDALHIPPDIPADAIAIALAALMAVGAVGITLTNSRLAAVAGLGLVGAGVSLVFVLFSAPDLAMAQFVIEILMVILLLLVLRHLPRFRGLSTRASRGAHAAVAVLAGAFMTLLVLSVLNVERGPRMSTFYLNNAKPGAHGRNLVNTVLVDFRALDTLGEITVLMLAAVGVLALLRLRPDPKEPK